MRSQNWALSLAEAVYLWGGGDTGLEESLCVGIYLYERGNLPTPGDNGVAHSLRSRLRTNLPTLLLGLTRPRVLLSVLKGPEPWLRQPLRGKVK